MLPALFTFFLVLVGAHSQKLLSKLEPFPIEPIRRPCPNFQYDADYNFMTGLNVVNENVKVVGALSGKGCSTQGVLELALAAASQDKSRRRVLIDLFFSNPQGWVFNLGDSKTNDGYSGDRSTQSRDAEVQGVGTTMTGYLSDQGSSAQAMSIANLYNTRLTLIAGDGHLVWLPNNSNLFNYYFNPNFFALNGQSDSQGPVNYNLYLGLNRVIAGAYRKGSGLCRVGIKFLPEF